MGMVQRVNELERVLKGIFRAFDSDVLTRHERASVDLAKRALREIRLDVRDYEYAMTRDEQHKWARLGRHNLTALNQALLQLGELIGAADMAKFGASIDILRSELQ